MTHDNNVTTRKLQHMGDKYKIAALENWPFGLKYTLKSIIRVKSTADLKKI